jgi:cytochrome P450
MAETVPSEELRTIDPVNPKTMECPYPFYELLRREAPIYKVPSADYFIVSRYADAQYVLRRHEDFSSDISHLFEGQGPGGTFIPSRVLNISDPPIHSLTKPIALRAFAPNRVNALEGKISAIVDGLIDKFVDKEEVEIMDEFARPLPMTVIAGQLGIPITELDRLALWSDQMLVFNNPAANAEERAYAQQVIKAANLYLMDVFRSKKINPTDDVISILANATTEPVPGAGPQRPLTDDEALSMMQLLLVGGNETTTNAIGNGMLLLTKNPGVVKELRAGAAPWDKTIEEILRMESPVRGFWRLTTRDTDIAGVPVAKNQLVFVSFASSNRDGDQFANPTCLDPYRQNTNAHLAFGHGIHLCVGFRLARKELGIAFRRLFERMDNIHLTPGRNDLDNLFVPTALVRGLKSLHLTFSKAKR